jgi:o-succinylbenzoate---CoA ligase
MSLPAGFDGALSSRPDDVAVRLGEDAWTWARLAERVSETSRRLRDAGAGPGDRVVIAATSSFETVVAVWAALAIDAHAVPLSPALPPAEQKRRAAAVGAGFVLEGVAVQSLTIDRAPTHAPSEGATLVFTSGTTASARAVVLPISALIASADGVVSGAGLKAGDAWLNPLPLSHVGGLGVLFRCARVGAETVLTGAFDAQEVRGTLASHRITHASLVARMLDRLLEARVAAGSLRCVLVGGGRTAPELLRRARQAGLPVVTTYGLSEAGSTVTLQRPDQPLGGAGDAGWPLPGRELRIGPQGEIEVAGECVMAGYDDGPAAPRWWPTGDRGRLLDDGRLVVLDRRTDLIVTGGENVSPVEVEAAIASVSAVLEVCVVGLPHPSWGQELCAVVRWRGLADPASVRTAVDGLAPWQRPRRWVDRREPLPRNALGKLLREQVQEQALKATED